MSTHTPGPWFVDPQDSGTILYGDDFWVADACSSVVRKEEREANARLIAAAPDLLAALDRLIEDAQPDNWDENDDEDPGLASAWRAAFRAICKARGEPVPDYMREDFKS